MGLQQLLKEWKWEKQLVLLLLYTFRDLWKEWGDSNFKIFSQNGQFHHMRLESLEHFNVIFIYHSEHYSLIFRGYHIIIIRSRLFSFCVHFHLHVCYVFNVIWQNLLMTDGLNAVLSNDCTAPTDTNPKNLELAPPQSVTATRLDQLVNSPNCYIQIFHSTFLACSEDRTPNRSLKVKVQCAYRLCYWAI